MVILISFSFKSKHLIIMNYFFKNRSIEKTKKIKLMAELIDIVVKFHLKKKRNSKKKIH